ELHADDVEAVVEVGAELPFLDRGREVAVRGGDDADVDRDRLHAADAQELAMLEYAQQLRLRRRAHLADLVEEERPLVRELELAELLRVRVGERALLVAEELALEQRLRDGGAVERDQRAVGARAPVVDRLGDQLLAGAALTGDEDRGAELRDGFDRLEDLLHLRRAADDVADVVAVADLAAELLELALQVGVLGRPLQVQPQLLDVERLGDVPERPELHGLDRRLQRLGRGQHDDRQVHVAGAELLEELHAVHPRYEDVEQHDVGGRAGERLERLLGGADGDRLVLVLQRHPERLAHALLVVHDQHPSFHRRLHHVLLLRQPAAGSRTTSVVAVPASGTTARPPPLHSSAWRASRKASGRKAGSPSSASPGDPVSRRRCAAACAPAAKRSVTTPLALASIARSSRGGTSRSTPAKRFRRA